MKIEKQLEKESDSEELEAEVVEKEQVEKFEIQKGTYMSQEMDAELIVREIADGKVIFDVSIYRAAGMDGVSAEIQGNKAVFEYEAEGGYDKTSGYLKNASKEHVEFVITKTELPFIEPGEWAFDYFSEEQRIELQRESYLSYLLLNDDSQGWVQGREIEYDSFSNVFMRFYPNGTIRYWYGTSLGGSTTYEEYTGKYSIRAEGLNQYILKIDNCEYQIDYMESTGLTSMTIRALGKYTLDLSGEYEMTENEGYQFLNKN